MKKKHNGKKSRPTEEGEGRSPPKSNLTGNSPKRSKREAIGRELKESRAQEEAMLPSEVVMEDVINQVTIELEMDSAPLVNEPNNRLDLIKSQKSNKYSSSNCPPYLVHVESFEGNISNFHPMSLGKVLADSFPAIINIKRRGKNLIVINFKFSFNANEFVLSKNLPDNWITYIPNYKIVSSTIVRGVDLNLSIDDINKGLKFMDRPIAIKSITRLKYRDKNYNNELRDSTSIKIEFLSNLLPEFISIWNVRSRVRPFVNRMRKCFNCFKWGHSSAFCRSSPVCTGCGRTHISDACADNSFLCPDCGQLHPLFDTECSIFQKYKVTNYIMAYCNINQYVAKKLAKIRNIVNCEQVEKTLSLQLTWHGIVLTSLKTIQDT